MIGVDIVAIGRIEKAYKRFGEKFLAWFLSPSEIDLLRQKAFRPSSIAGFWAAKEACAKAFGTGIGDRFSFHDMIISYNAHHAPLITSHKLAHYHCALSISHDGGFAIAVVALEFTQDSTNKPNT